MDKKKEKVGKLSDSRFLHFPSIIWKKRSWGKIKVEKISKGSLDSISSPSPSLKIQIMGGKVSLRCKGKTSFVLLNTVLGKVGLNMMTFPVLQNINPTLVTKLLGEMKDFKYKSWLPHFHPFFYLIVKEEYVFSINL